VLFKTPFNGYAVEFSPFDEAKLAVATAQHFGIIGNGKQHILQIQGNQIREIACFDSRDGLYDCSWSEENENHLISASGDGTLKLWDILAPHGQPLRSYEEHTAEVYSVDWNLIHKTTFISGAWDETIKLWDPTRNNSLVTLKEHTYCIYATVWSPHHADRFASASGDKLVKIWDAREPNSVQTIRAHNQEVLTCDWNKYNEWTLVTGSVDKSIRLWDIRNAAKGPVGSLKGHNYAVRRLKCSPHSETVILSCSYDMTSMLWDTIQEDPLIQRYEHHTEFVVGLDFNMFIEGQLATCSWDETVAVWMVGQRP